MEDRVSAENLKPRLSDLIDPGYELLRVNDRHLTAWWTRHSEENVLRNPVFEEAAAGEG